MFLVILGYYEVLNTRRESVSRLKDLAGEILRNSAPEKS